MIIPEEQRESIADSWIRTVPDDWCRTSFDDWCRRCFHQNPVWCAPSPLWNAVMREDGHINGVEKFDGIVCPGCFIQLADEMGVPGIWRLYAPDVDMEDGSLEMVSPSGRIWDADRWLWVMPPGAVPRDPSAEAHAERNRTRQLAVIKDVLTERQAQDAKWGEQNHPDGTGPDRGWVGAGFAELLKYRPEQDNRAAFRDWAIDRCKVLFARKQGTWEAILTEEWTEALAAEDLAELRNEVIQIAAVAVAWVEDLDRRNQEGDIDGEIPTAPTA